MADMEKTHTRFVWVKWLRRLLFTLSGLILLLALFWAGLQTPWAKDRLTGLVASVTAESGDYQVTLQGLDGFLPFSVVVDRVTLSDTHGVWLEGRNADISMRPWALLRGVMDVEWFRMKSLSIFRRPGSIRDTPDKKKAPDQKEGPLSLPHVMIHEMRINRIDLSKAVAGAPMAYSLQSRVETVHQRIQARAEVKNLHHKDHALRLSATYHLEEQHISTHLTYYEPAGGLVTGLLNLKDTHGMEIDFRADGPLSRVKGQLHMEMGGYGTGELRYQVGLSQDLTVALDGRIEVESGRVPGHVTDALGGLNVDITGRAAISPEHVIRINTFTARAPSSSLSVKGALDLTKGVMNMQAAASPVHMAPFLKGTGLTYRALGPVQLTATGPFMQPSIGVTTTVDELRGQGITAEEIAIKSKFTFEQDFTGLKAAHVWGTAQSAHAPQTPGLKGPLQVDLTAKSPDFATWDIKRLHLTTNDADVQVEDARMDTVTGRFSAELRTRIHRLQTLMPAEGSPINGRLTLHTRADGNYNTGPIRAHVDGTFTDLSGLPPVAAETVGPELTVKTRLFLADDTLKMDQAHITGKDLDLTADGQLHMERGAFDAQYRLSLGQLPELEETTGLDLAGRVTSQGRVQGDFADFTAHMGLESTNLTINDLHVQALQAQVRAKGLPHTPSGNITLKGTALDQPLAVDGGFAWSGEVLALSGIEASLPGIGLTTDLDIMPGKNRISGTARGDVASLDLLRAVTGIDVQGNGDFRLESGGKDRGMGLTLDARFNDLRYKTHELSTVTLKTRLDDWTPLEGRVHITAGDVALQAARLKNLELKAEGTLNQARVSLKTQGTLSHTGQHGMALSTRLDVAHGERWQFRLDELKASYRNLNITLPHPATVTMDNGRIVLDELNLHTAKGRLTAKGELDTETIQVSARINDLPLALFEPVFDRELTGVASISLDLSGPLVDPAVNVGGHIRDYRISGRDHMRPLMLEAKLNATRKGKRFQVDAKLSGLGNAPFTAKGSIPAHLSFKPFAFHLDPEADITGNLQGRLDMAVLQGLPGMDDHTLTGQVDVDLGVAGPVREWTLNGEATISRGRYENGALGLILDSINGRLEAAGRTLRLTRLSATDPHEGAIDLEGDITMEPPFPMDARLTFKEATLLQKEILTTRASGNLRINGTKDRLDLTGDIRLDRAELTIPGRLPPDVVEIPVKEINLPSGMSTEPVEAGEALKFLFMDIVVEIPARFFVRGHGLDAEFKGRLTAQGPAHNPVVRGTLRVVRGTYQFLARTFHITEGQIVFDGSTPPTPFLNVMAQVNAGEIDAQVRITGPADDFDLALTSQPPLPQDEIMANILFGRSAAKLNPFQAYQLASAITQLSGSGMPDVMGKTRKLLGVDRLTISGGDDGDGPDTGPSVEAGRYVSEKVYVGMEQDLTDAQQDIVVEVDITPSFSVKSKAGSKSGAGLGFSWKYDY